MMNWKQAQLSQLSHHELYQMLKLRVDVFVVEQTCPYPDLDDKDWQAGVEHLIALNENNQVVACARLLPAGVSYDNVSIGRIVTAPDYRGTGVGHQLLERAINACLTRWGQVDIDISAQHHLQGYYQKHGFIAISEPYLEDDIPHIKMRRSA